MVQPLTLCCQVIVDTYQNVLDGPNNKFEGLQDYNSFLIFEDISVQTSLTLFPLARKEDTLNTIKYSFNIIGVSYMRVNWEFFTVDSFYRLLVRLKSTNPQLLHWKMEYSKYDPCSLPWSCCRWDARLSSPRRSENLLRKRVLPCCC